MTDVPVLIEPAALNELRATHPVVLIDTRDPEAYAAEHLPGAVNVRQIFTVLVEDSRPETMKGLQQDFARSLGAAGLSGEEIAVIYEDALDSGYGQSCRGYFLLRYFGYSRVAILHGGYQAWKQAGLAVTAEPSQPTPKQFPLAINDSVLLGKDDMLSALDNSAIVKLDVRDEPEWIGDSSSPYGADFCPRKGRIPNSVWIEWYDFMDRSGEAPRFRSPDEIRALCGEFGIVPEDEVYVFCFKGSRAANVMVAMEQAGFSKVRNYFASWNEWSRDPALPIETGAPDPKRPKHR